MTAYQVKTPAPGETLVGIEPELLQQVEPGWRHRMSPFTGRALTDAALSAEQGYRSGRLALTSQLITPGIGAGLELVIGSDARVRVLAGYGFTALGEDVTLAGELAVSLDDILVVDPVTAAPFKAFGALKKDAATPGGVFVVLLQPVTGRATGAEIDTGAGPVVVSGDLNASCARDPEQYAFEDWEIVDGTRIVLAAWPDPPDSLKLPAAAPINTFRNRLATMVFGAEAQLGSDGYLPWEAIGVALAIVAFDAAWQTLFVDRNVVVRSGGRARRTGLVHPTLAQPGDFAPVSKASAEARILQLLEQNAALQTQTDFTAFMTLPPTGIVPAAALDLVAHKNKWFPKAWTVRVAPIHAEEVETALRSQLLAAPLDLTGQEKIDVLLPLSDDTYDPDVLVVEHLAAEFTLEQQKATAGRDSVVRHRAFLQFESNALRVILAQSPLDLDAGLTDAEVSARKLASYVAPADGSESYGTQMVDGVAVATDVQSLKATADAAPFTISLTVPPATPAGPPITKALPLIGADDWADLKANGLQHFMDLIGARLDRVDDLLNLSFLQTQTNIYRYRTNVLSATDAGRLVTSPIVANIAQRESAVATAQDLSTYIASISLAPKASTTPAAPVASPSVPIASPSVMVLRPMLRAFASAPQPTASISGLSSAVLATSSLIAPALTAVARSPVTIAHLPSQTSLPRSEDVTSQLPLAGAEFNLRTLSVAERLKTSPSDEALGYVVSHRADFLDRIVAQDFGISVDDLEILVQEQVLDAAGKPVFDSQGKPTFAPRRYPIAQLRDPATKTRVYGVMLQAGLAPNSDEAGAFSAGITSLDHHALLLRAVEGRIALYRQFLRLCDGALAAVKGHASAILSALTQVENELSQSRQNMAFIDAIIDDENARLVAVNSRRAQILANVPFLVYMRPRTIDTEASVPSCQLVPANVASPVPAALASNAVVPPELREMASLLREAPPSWLPATDPLLSRLDRLQNFVDVARVMQVRASVKLQLPMMQSSATSHPGPYGAPLAETFTSQQRVFTALLQSRAAYQPSVLAQLTWGAQKREIYNVSAVNDLISADSVHLELANEIAVLIGNVSKMATALYLRVGDALPADRLRWADYLGAAGRTVSLRSLAILPGWNGQDYVGRQQMQMLVDWLFSQIDTSIPGAVSYVSDLARTAVLLASHAPVNDVIAGEIAARIRPAVGGVVAITTPSQRIARGMPVLLYQGATVAARAVVDDLDFQQVYAKVTAVYQDAYLEKSAQAHFMNDDPQGAVLAKAFRARA